MAARKNNAKDSQSKRAEKIRKERGNKKIKGTDNGEKRPNFVRCARTELKYC